jgi:prephenate dehydratase
VKVGYLGPQGTFSQEAALQYVEGDAARLQPYPSISGVFEALAAREISQGIVPVENSLQGSVTQTLDDLAKIGRPLVQGELVIPVDHYLLRVRGAQGPVEYISSHPQALAQCRGYLDKHYPQVERRWAASTAEAAANLVDAGGLAIGPRILADLYDLDIVAACIQDAPENVSRFLVIGSGDAPPSGDDLTSIVFTPLSEGPGVLYHILAEFATRQINLTKIESRPTKRYLGQYRFFIDFVGHRLLSPAKEALAAVKRQCKELHVLGSYPRNRSGSKNPGQEQVVDI